VRVASLKLIAMRRCKFRQLRGLAGYRMPIGLLLSGLCSVAMAQAPTELSRAVQIYEREHGGAEASAFRWALADLNDDGRDDAIVLLSGPKHCGSGGCTMLVFRGTEQGFSLISASNIVMGPIRVSAKSVEGWRSLIVYSKGKGEVVLRFSGSRYPSDPSQQPAASRLELEAAASAIQ
jgi:hypothetical protein